jgi:hypothetical protein
MYRKGIGTDVDAVKADQYTKEAKEILDGVNLGLTG